MASFGSCDPAHHGAISRRSSAPILLATIGSFAGVWGRLMDALAAAHDAEIQIIDPSIVRVHQHAAWIARHKDSPWAGREEVTPARYMQRLTAAGCRSG